MSNIKELIKMSNTYGADPAFVLAGGGNTSFKDDKYLYVKGSGTSLATIGENGFVKMEREKLSLMWCKDYGRDLAYAEKAVLRDMMDARSLGEEEKRPSVETLLHEMMPYKLVLHVHPALVNGLTCGKKGKEKCAAILPDALFMDAEKPGYILAIAAKKATDEFKNKRGAFPDTIFMQNHGVFFGADTLADMDKLVSKVMSALNSAASSSYDFTETDLSPEKKETAAFAAVILRTLYKKYEGSGLCLFTLNKDIESLVKSKKACMDKVGKAFTPDHIVYCRHEPLYISDPGKDAIITAFDEYRKKNGFSPKIVFVEGLGMFSLGKTKKESDIAATVYLDEIKISAYSENFGGQQFMTDEDIDFILNWEVESYRQKVSLGGSVKRLLGKIVFITGAAQGYGKGIAEEMAKQGACVVIADLNYDGAAATAKEICDMCGGGSAFAARVDVSNEDDVKGAITDAVLYYGGLDAFISNAGVVKAGSLEEMDLRSFDFVTRINYNAFFICTKYASRIMKTAHSVSESDFFDIIQINSKSGLAGSNKNFAYAGSKFGGIGLVQSFALELTPHNIKVNALCPGNFFEGPLWSDPEKGLFVQYLNAGKIKGAKTVADVKAAYEAKIPMGRGCRIEDLVRGIFYVIEQEYETGQAIPVTGGQEMLK